MKHNSGFPRLGFGCMRLSKNYEDTEEQLLHALSQGVDYFDTAYIYPGNEELLGRFMEKNRCRSQMKIATKLPHYLMKKATDMERYFQIQCKRLKTDYIDHYLIHMLPDKTIWERLVDLGLPQWLEEKKKNGTIGKVGFSYHGNTANFLELLDVFPWDFCQVQYNYMDEFAQAGRPGVEAAHSRGIPVIIMEPLRGGLLTSGLPRAAATLIEAENRRRGLAGLPARSPAQWALRWLWDQETITCVLSGMNTMEMLKENIAIAEDSLPGHLTHEDHAFYEQLKEAFAENIAVPCTTCGYCMPCPFGVDIPGTFRCFNVAKQDGYRKAFKEYVMTTSFTVEGSNAGKCTRCGACLPHCPQSIQIPDYMKKVKRKFEHPAYTIARSYIKKRMLNKK